MYNKHTLCVVDKKWLLIGNNVRAHTFIRDNISPRLLEYVRSEKLLALINTFAVNKLNEP